MEEKQYKTKCKIVGTETPLEMCKRLTFFHAINGSNLQSFLLRCGNAENGICWNLNLPSKITVIKWIIYSRS